MDAAWALILTSNDGTYSVGNPQPTRQTPTAPVRCKTFKVDCFTLELENYSAGGGQQIQKPAVKNGGEVITPILPVDG